MTRNKELEAVLEPKEGEEVVLYEVLDKDIKPPSAKTRSHRKDSHSEQCDGRLYNLGSLRSNDADDN